VKNFSVSRRPLRTVTLLCCTVVVSALLSACSFGVDSNGYPQASRDAFISACEEGGSPLDFCECALDAIETAIPYDRFVEIDAAINAGTATAEDNQVIIDAIDACS
jgi:hypothetical protein